MNLWQALIKDGMKISVGVAALISFMFLIYASVYVKMHNEQVVNILIGQVSGIVGTIAAFYYGSSKSSDRKTEIMAEQAK